MARPPTTRPRYEHGLGMDPDHIDLFEPAILNVVRQDQRFTFSRTITTPFQFV